MKKKILIGLGLILFIFYLISGYIYSKSPKIALISIDGVISEYVDILNLIEEAKKDNSIKAVVIKVDSPGGAVGASQEIYRAIEKLREKKPVIVSMGNVAASGGYYISAPANIIYANPGTITGSIGVIIQQVDASEILNKIGIKINNIKSGENKDILYPNKPLTPEQKALLQQTVLDVYNQFLDAIVKYRKIDRNILIKYADGRIFSGKEAQKLGLVDKLGNLQDAIEEAKKLSNEKEITIIELKPKKPLLDELFNSKLSLSEVKSGIYYLFSF
ncbi:signal peptide peptidase SppA [Venenivibrio stagnispumantis]|uniref:Protease-4 n=1 Tax=Venenivibrio stagnispumantis TaxID=407998 RepID=A0AA46ADS4_9AQUI|nr:signal peptide peptidase SppA [Venenivibrio stagnispumantis]MCW4573049.1 signal peptide peptidase SppA [Venenivibrio stagnispumantis]SMP07296.1 protease-4 [Venenivibrio stagnispumantis]